MTHSYLAQNHLLYLIYNLIQTALKLIKKLFNKKAHFNFIEMFMHLFKTFETGNFAKKKRTKILKLFCGYKL